MSYTLAIGPDAPFWPGSQRLILTIEGEVVTDVHYRPDEEPPAFLARLPRLDLEQTVYEVLHGFGSSSQAHGLALCLALETLTDTLVPNRAHYLRCAIAEIERLWSHLRAVRSLFEVLGLRRQTAVLQELVGQAREALHIFGGDPEVPDLLVPGGLRKDITFEQYEWLVRLLETINQLLFELIDHAIDDTRLLARTVNVGTLSREVTAQFLLRGPLARAAGLDADVRLDEPYAAYGDLTVRRIIQEGGDVHARLVMLLLEAFEALKLAEQALQAMPGGDNLLGDFPAELPAGTASAAVESPQGLLRYTIVSDGYRLTDLTIDAPVHIDRLLARTLFVGALVDNVPLIVLSTDPCIRHAEV